MAIVFAAFGLSSHRASPDGIKKPAAVNIRFCNAEGFSEQKKRCISSVDQFPEGISKVYVSFELHNVPENTAFERRWYHNGVEFHRKGSFADDLWEGWTWLSAEQLSEPGEIAMRVVVGGNVSSHKFMIVEQK